MFMISYCGQGHFGDNRVGGADATGATDEHRVVNRHVGYAIQRFHLTMVAQHNGPKDSVVGG